MIGVEAGQLDGRQRRSIGSRRARSIGRGHARPPSIRPITAANYNVDARSFQVKIAEGALYPTVQLQGSVNQDVRLDHQPQHLAEPLGADGGAARRCRSIRAAQRIRDDPPVQGDARAAAAGSRHGARSGAADGRTQAWGQLEAAKAQIEVDPGAGQCGRNSAQRRARGSARRSAHHARRAQRAAGPGQRPRRRSSPRSATGSLRRTPCWRRPAACRHRFSGSGPELRSGDALSPGPRQLGWCSHARRALSSAIPQCCCRLDTTNPCVHTSNCHTGSARELVSVAVRSQLIRFE